MRPYLAILQDSFRFALSSRVLLVMIVGNIWFRGIQSLGTFLGLVSAGLAIANYHGW